MQRPGERRGGDPADPRGAARPRIRRRRRRAGRGGAGPRGWRTRWPAGGRGGARGRFSSLPGHGSNGSAPDWIGPSGPRHPPGRSIRVLLDPWRRPGADPGPECREKILQIRGENPVSSLCMGSSASKISPSSGRVSVCVSARPELGRCGWRWARAALIAVDVGAADGVSLSRLAPPPATGVWGGAAVGRLL